MRNSRSLAHKRQHSKSVFIEDNREDIKEDLEMAGQKAKESPEGAMDNDFSIVRADMRDFEAQHQAAEGDEGDDKENINVRAAIVHMIGDMVQSAGVIIAAVIIYYRPDWKIADPICTFLFSILVMITTIPIFRDCMRMLMESSPTDIEVVKVYNAIQEMPGVCEVHDFHLWSLSDEKPILTAHIVSNENPSSILYQVTEMLQRDFEIYLSTIQVEPMKFSHSE